MSDAQRPPTPRDLRHLKRPVPPVPPRQRVSFKTATGYPRNGRRDAITWTDTGILLSVGARAGATQWFVRLYGGWLRTARHVVKELRGLSEQVNPATDHDRDVRDAASSAVGSLLLAGQEKLDVRALSVADLPAFEVITQQLRGLSKNPEASHRGEAELITMAASDATTSGTPQVLLSNDAGASVVAHAHGVPTRHIGDVLCEMACADATVNPDELYDAMTVMTAVSSVQARVLPPDAAALACRRTAGTCVHCDKDAGSVGRPARR